MPARSIGEGEQMDFKELPAQELVAATTNLWELERALRVTLGRRSQERCYDIARDGPCSTRVIAPAGTPASKRDGMVRFPKDATSDLAVARSLVRLIEEDGARIAGRRPPGHEPGWRIGRSILDGTPVAIAMAVWVESDSPRDEPEQALLL